MKKRRTNTERNYGNVEPFIKVNTDSISFLPDRKVEQLLEKYKLKRRTSRPEFHKDLEEEICYIFREHEIRKRRKFAHQVYLKKKGFRRAK